MTEQPRRSERIATKKNGGVHETKEHIPNDEARAPVDEESSDSGELVVAQKTDNGMQDDAGLVTRVWNNWVFRGFVNIFVGRIILFGIALLVSLAVLYSGLDFNMCWDVPIIRRVCVYPVVGLFMFGVILFYIVFTDDFTGWPLARIKK